MGYRERRQEPIYRNGLRGARVELDGIRKTLTLTGGGSEVTWEKIV